ncbi:MAG: DUF2752 domain-containing protein [Nocardioides sp.]
MSLGQLPARTSHPGASSRARRLATPLLSAGVAGGLTLALHVRDPHTQGSWGFCPFKALTGWDCPGCGGLRAVNDLTHLDVGAAASSNLLFVVAIPLVVAAWLAWTRRAWLVQASEGRRAPAIGHPLLWGQLALVVLAAFTLVRNLPLGGWLAA